MNLLNIGCGAIFHPDWVNLDLISISPAVQAGDFRRGLPYPDASFDACYSSHVLEHLTRPEVESLLAECFRVLKPQGVIRVVVPDLEGIARAYLEALEQAAAGSETAELNYDWMLLELYDQTVRQQIGGEMGRYLRQPDLPNREFVLARMGYEAEELLRAIATPPNRTLSQKLRSKSLAWWLQTIRIGLAKGMVSLLAGREARQSFEEGLFRNSGEIHRWMYDRFSLGRLLARSHFQSIRCCQADESRIPDFDTYQLDRIAGQIRKPDSLFMEAIKL